MLWSGLIGLDEEVGVLLTLVLRQMPLSMALLFLLGDGGGLARKRRLGGHSLSSTSVSSMRGMLWIQSLIKNSGVVMKLWMEVFVSGFSSPSQRELRNAFTTRICREGQKERDKRENESLTYGCQTQCQALIVGFAHCLSSWHVHGQGRVAENSTQSFYHRTSSLYANPLDIRQCRPSVVNGSPNQFPTLLIKIGVHLYYQVIVVVYQFNCHGLLQRILETIAENSLLETPRQ